MPTAAPQQAVAVDASAESGCNSQQDEDQRDHSHTLQSPDSPPLSGAGIPAAQAISAVGAVGFQLPPLVSASTPAPPGSPDSPPAGNVGIPAVQAITAGGAEGFQLPLLPYAPAPAPPLPPGSLLSSSAANAAAQITDGGAEGFQLPLLQDAQTPAPPLPPGSLLDSSASSSPLLSITDPDADGEGTGISPPDGSRSSWSGGGDGSATGRSSGNGSSGRSRASSAAASSASVASLQPADTAVGGCAQAGGDDGGRDTSIAGSAGSSGSGGSSVVTPAALRSAGSESTSEPDQLPAQPEPTQQPQPQQQIRAGSATRRREAGSSDDAAGEPQPKRRRSSTGGAQVDTENASSHSAEDRLQPFGIAAAHVTAAHLSFSGNSGRGLSGSNDSFDVPTNSPEEPADAPACWQAPSAVAWHTQPAEVSVAPAAAALPDGRASSHAATFNAAVQTATPALHLGAAQPAVVSNAQLGDGADRAAGEIIGQSGGRLITVRSRHTSSGDGSAVSSGTASADGAATGGVHCF